MMMGHVGEESFHAIDNQTHTAKRKYTKKNKYTKSLNTNKLVLVKKKTEKHVRTVTYKNCSYVCVCVCVTVHNCDTHGTCTEQF